MLVFGPTILDLSNQLDVSVGVLSAMFVCRAVGIALGSITAGVTLDKLHHFAYTFMSLVFFSSIVSELVGSGMNVQNLPKIQLLGLVPSLFS